MASVNEAVKQPPVFNHEGVKAVRNPTPLYELRRSVLSSLLFENEYYESGKNHVKRVVELIHQCNPTDVALLAMEARSQMYLRHMPLLLVRELALISC